MYTEDGLYRALNCDVVLCMTRKLCDVMYFNMHVNKGGIGGEILNTGCTHNTTGRRAGTCASLGRTGEAWIHTEITHLLCSS